MCRWTIITGTKKNAEEIDLICAYEKAIQRYVWYDLSARSKPPSMIPFTIYNFTFTYTFTSTHLKKNPIAYHIYTYTYTYTFQWEKFRGLVLPIAGGTTSCVR